MNIAIQTLIRLSETAYSLVLAVAKVHSWHQGQQAVLEASCRPRDEVLVRWSTYSMAFPNFQQEHIIIW